MNIVDISSSDEDDVLDEGLSMREASNSNEFLTVNDGASTSRDLTSMHEVSNPIRCLMVNDGASTSQLHPQQNGNSGKFILKV